MPQQVHDALVSHIEAAIHVETSKLGAAGSNGSQTVVGDQLAKGRMQQAQAAAVCRQVDQTRVTDLA